MNTFIAQKQPDKAVAAASEQIAKSPNNSGFYDLLGTALFFSKKDLGAAEAAFDKSVALDKHNSDAVLKLCQVQAGREKLIRLSAPPAGAHEQPARTGPPRRNGKVV